MADNAGVPTSPAQRPADSYDPRSEARFRSSLEQDSARISATLEDIQGRVQTAEDDIDTLEAETELGAEQASTLYPSVNFTPSATGVWETVALDSADVDTDGWADTANNQIQVTDAGVYLISYSASVHAVQNDEILLRIKAADGGSTRVRMEQKHTDDSSHLAGLGSAIPLSLAASEIITLEAQVSNLNNFVEGGVEHTTLSVART